MTGSTAQVRTYAPLRRVLALLRFLTEQARASSSRVFTHAELLEALAREYESGPTAERTLRGDLRALRDRGLVVTNLRHHDHVRLRGVRRNPALVKTRDLWLTTDEHGALQDARALLGGRLPRVAPTTAPADAQGRANARVEDALLIIRLLEEAHDEVEVDVVAAALGVGRQQAQRWLEEVADVYGDALRRRHRSDPESEDYDLAELTVHGDSLTGTGADLLGLFPYSAAEVHERLVLLDDFAASVRAHLVSPKLLGSVRRKLTRWLDELDRAGLNHSA